MEVTIIISSAVISAAISLAGVIISALIAKSSATKTARITSETEIKKLKIELTYSQDIRSEDHAWEETRNITTTYQTMISAVTGFRNKPDVNTKTAAVDAVLALMLTTNEPTSAIKQLLEFVQSADAFDGPDTAELDVLLSQIIEER